MAAAPHHPISAGFGAIVGSLPVSAEHYSIIQSREIRDEHGRGQVC